MNGYTVEFRPSARKAIDRLPDVLFRRIQPAIDRLSHHPRPQGCVKLSGHQRLWRIRVGDYRIVYEILDDRRIVIILVVAHRRQSYRGL